MRPASCKAKGRRLQAWAAAELAREFGLSTDDVRSTSMGCGGEDLQLSAAARGVLGGLSFECKNQERIALYDCWEQAKQNAGEHAPALVLKRNHSDVLCVIGWPTLVRLLRGPARRDGEPTPAADPTSVAERLRALAAELEARA